MMLPRMTAANALVDSTNRVSARTLAWAGIGPASRIKAFSIKKLKFGTNWDEGDNNDYVYKGDDGPMSANDIYQVLSKSKSEAVQEAVECGILTVVKGCHQDDAPHITVNAEHKTKGVSEKCQRNALFGSRRLHLNCRSGEIIRTD